jgi:nucleotide-binding universal stress UspA family protein
MWRTLDEAVAASLVENSKLMVAVHYTNPRVLDEVAVHAKGMKQKNVYVVFVDELPGLFVPLELKPTAASQRTLVDSCEYLSKKGINGIPVWRLAEDAGSSLAEAANALGVNTVFVGSSKRTFFWRMVKGRMLKRLAELLPEDSNLLVVG